jgi:hypothetical protein
MDSPIPLIAATTIQPLSLQGTRLNLPAMRGRYLLTVKDAKGKINVERTADFVIE